MDEPTTIDLTPVQVRRLEEARSRLAVASTVYAEPLAEYHAAMKCANDALATIIKSAGHEVNGDVWDIAEEGDSVRLVRRAHES